MNAEIKILSCRTRADEEAEREAQEALRQQERLAELDAQLKLQVCCF